MFQISKDSPLPLHTQLLNELRHAILSGKLKPFERLPGELELVTAMGISRATVQHAWQAAEDEGLIFRIAGKGTFVAEPPAAQKPRTFVGFLIPEFRSTFDSHLLTGAESVLRVHGYRLLFAHSGRDLDEENRLLAEMRSENVAGFLIWPAMGKAAGRFLADPAHRNTPAVLMDRPIPGLALPCVSSQNHTGGLQAVRHLLALGHQDIVFLSRPHLDLWPIAERLRAYEDAMQAAGLEPLPPLLLGNRTEISAYEVYMQLPREDIDQLATILSQPDRPTAIFAMNDLMALWVLRAAALAGLKVPDDLSVVGFDNLDLTLHIDPPLTTVAQNSMLMGAEAARRLLALIEGEPIQDILTLLPTELIVRSSTASPPDARKGGNQRRQKMMQTMEKPL